MAVSAAVLALIAAVSAAVIEALSLSTHPVKEVTASKNARHFFIGFIGSLDGGLDDFEPLVRETQEVAEIEDRRGMHAARLTHATATPKRQMRL